MVIRAKVFLFILLMSLPVIAEEESEMAFFLFIAEFTDEKGNWDAPELEESSSEAEPEEAEQ